MLVVMAIVLLMGCRSRDTTLEIDLSKRLKEFRFSNAESLDLRPIIGSDWEKVCIQSPYIDQPNFEKNVGRKVQGFEFISDDVHVLWVFYRDGKFRWARIPRMDVMDRHSKKGKGCTSIDRPYIYAADDGGTKKYFFNE